MILALLILLCLGVLVLSTWRGYRKGALAQLVGLAALALAWLAGWATARSGASVPFLEPIPRLLHPYLLAVGAALASFAVLSIAGGLWLRRADREAAEAALADGAEKPHEHTLTNAPWNRWAGLAIGALQGVVLSAALLLAGALAGNLAMAFEAAYAAAPRPHGEKTPALQGALSDLGRQFEATPLGDAAASVSPVKPRQIELAVELSRVAADEQAARRLSRHPAVQRWARDERFLELSRDREVLRAVKEERWADLMDHPGVLALLKDRALVRELRQIDLEALLRHAKGP